MAKRTLTLNYLWRKARKYAEANGLEHSYAGVQGIAPL